MNLSNAFKKPVLDYCVSNEGPVPLTGQSPKDEGAVDQGQRGQVPGQFPRDLGQPLQFHRGADQAKESAGHRLLLGRVVRVRQVEIGPFGGQVGLAE